MGPELKPCPVCKYRAKLRKLCVPGWYAVACSEDGLWHNTGAVKGEEEAVHRWNNWDGGEWTKEET